MAEEQSSEAQAAPGRDVFISYASHDKAVADTVCAALESAGVACWIAPRDVTPGKFYAESIVHAIDSTKAIVLVLSESAAESQHVLREVERASSRRHPVISFRIDTAPLPAALEYFLNSSQWLDASATGVKRALPRVVDAVKSAVAQPVDPAHAAPGPATTSRPKQMQRRMLFLLGVALTVVLGYFVLGRGWHTQPAPTGQPTTVAANAVSEKSIAVLPFVDMSEKHDQEYFSDGLSEELIDLLAHAVDLKVIARTSSFQFKGKNEDMRTIGHRLGVANLLEGSVRTSGNVMRVTAQLINVVDGVHRWSATYDRPRGDIFKVQDEIAAAVVAALKATMGAIPSGARAHEVNIDSYNETLWGRYFDERGTKEDSERALAAFQRAIKLDPENARAWVGIAAVYYTRGAMSWMPAPEAYAEARNAVDRALTINPDLPSAHGYRGALEWYYQRDFPAAEREFKRARELDPSHSVDFAFEANVAYAAGRVDAAVSAWRNAVAVDPLDLNSLFGLASTLYDAKDYAEAERIYQQILELSPGAAGAYCQLGQIRLAQHHPEAALAMMSREADEGIRMTCMPDALWELGRHQEAEEMIAQVQNRFADTMAFALACWHAGRNDNDAAFKWLERSYDNHEPAITMIKGVPVLRPLHSDPRYAALLQKLNLPK